MRKIILLYIPVLHEGYIKFLRKHKRHAHTLYILGGRFVSQLSRFRKEIRAMDAKTVKTLIESLQMFEHVEVLERRLPREFKCAEIISADEEISRAFAKKYLPKNHVRFDSVFLRWDEKKVSSPVKVKYSRVSRSPFDRRMVARASQEADKSSDWWRHVGSVVTKNKKVILESHNQHVPSEQMPYAVGDPRDVIDPGAKNLLYSSIHAEQEVIARAASDGISLKGASIYMNIFPCPLCAKLVAYSGIKKCFFKAGAAWLDAEHVLKARGVEIVLVK